MFDLRTSKRQPLPECLLHQVASPTPATEAIFISELVSSDSSEQDPTLAATRVAPSEPNLFVKYLWKNNKIPMLDVSTKVSPSGVIIHTLARNMPLGCPGSSGLGCESSPREGIDR